MSELADILNSSKNAVFFGGAGVSTASGIPDFRSSKGIYNTNNRFDISPEAIISHGYFTKHTKAFYDYYLKNMVFPNAKPNAVHYALAKLEARDKLKAVITQNIDGLHQMAGSQTVYELHGSVLRNYCMDCHKFYNLDKIINSNDVPRCDCGGIIKPDVVLYQEPLDNEVWEKAERALALADTLIVGGSTLTVMPAAYLVQKFQGKLVIINNMPTPYDKKAELVIHDDLVKVFN